MVKATVAAPAGVPVRIGALVYDLLLVTALVMLTFALFLPFSGGEAVTGIWTQLVIPGVTFAYYSFCWLKSGQTLGMLAWRLKLVNEKGGSVSFGQCLIRSLVAPFSIALAFLGYIWFYIGSAQQTWHDRASHTYVVRLPKTP